MTSIAGVSQTRHAEHVYLSFLTGTCKPLLGDYHVIANYCCQYMLELEDASFEATRLVVSDESLSAVMAQPIECKTNSTHITSGIPDWCTRR